MHESHDLCILGISMASVSRHESCTSCSNGTMNELREYYFRDPYELLGLYERGLLQLC